MRKFKINKIKLHNLQKINKVFKKSWQIQKKISYTSNVFFFPHHLDLTTIATLEKINKKRSKALMSYTQNIDYR